MTFPDFPWPWEPCQAELQCRHEEVWSAQWIQCPNPWAKVGWESRRPLLMWLIVNRLVLTMPLWVIPARIIKFWKTSPPDPLRFFWKKYMWWEIFLVGYIQNFRSLLCILFAQKIVKGNGKRSFLAAFSTSLSGWPCSKCNISKYI